MSRLPRLTGGEVIAALEKAGFVVVRTRGSHHRLHHADGRVTTVPVHGSEIIGPAFSPAYCATAICRGQISTRCSRVGRERHPGH
ncbi:type II toxin-antitoxin system HicA family toxin [Astrobacterium formosum]|uniref:type II toxin-antitoxin system HicA family toxin n=1 Tax=Astrobacterium formosum TaxID=3069710 RepID=UPI003F50050C